MRTRFFSFCEAILVPWLALGNVFFVVVGAAPFLSYVGPTASVSNGQCIFERLELRLLQPSAIEQNITKTPMTMVQDKTTEKTIQERRTA